MTKKIARTLAQKARAFVTHPLVAPFSEIGKALAFFPRDAINGFVCTMQGGYAHGRKHGLGRIRSALGAHWYGFSSKDPGTPHPWDTSPRFHDYSEIGAMLQGQSTLPRMIGGMAGIFTAIFAMPAGIVSLNVALGITAGGAALGALVFGNVATTAFYGALGAVIGPLGFKDEIVHAFKEAGKYIRDRKNFTPAAFVKPVPPPPALMKLPKAPQPTAETMAMDVHALTPEERRALIDRLAQDFAEDFEAARKKRIGDIDPRVKKSTQSAPMPDIKKNPFPGARHDG